MPTPQKEQSIKLGDGPVPTVNVFKYLGSLFAAEGGSETDVNNGAKAACDKWREVSGVMYDKKTPTKIKHIHCNDMRVWLLRKKDTQKLDTIEVVILRRARGKTIKDQQWKAFSLPWWSTHLVYPDEVHI